MKKFFGKSLIVAAAVFLAACSDSAEIECNCKHECTCGSSGNGTTAGTGGTTAGTGGTTTGTGGTTTGTGGTTAGTGGTTAGTGGTTGSGTGGTTTGSVSDLPVNLRPAIGKIYYTDGTASYEYIEGKTPVGFVVSINSDGTVDTIISLIESEDGIAFDSDITWYVATTTNDGKTNTENLYNYKNSLSAVKYCVNFDAGIEGFGAGKWYLPAYNEMVVLNDNYDLFSESSKSLVVNAYTGKYKRIHSGNYWTSTMYITTTTSDKNRYFYYYNPEKGSGTYTSKESKLYVRPMYKFDYSASE